MRLGIRLKLLLVFTAITLIGGIALFLSAGFQLEHATLGFYQRDLLTQTLQAANTLSEPLEHYLDGEYTNANLQYALEKIPNPENHSRPSYTLLTVNRAVLASTASPRMPLFAEVDTSEELAAAMNGRANYSVQAGDTGEDTVFAFAPILYEDDLLGILQAAVPLAPAYNEVIQNWLNLARIALPILVLVVAASLWLGRSISTPLLQLNQSALRFAGGDLDERVSVTTSDEIGQLAESFNTMAEEISSLMIAQRSFISNAAHELRSPLAHAQLRLETLQSTTLSTEQQMLYLAETGEAVKHMSELITQLLALARLDEGRIVRTNPVLEDTTTFLQDLSRRWRIQAQHASLHFEGAVPPALPPLAIASNDLQILLENLIGNALKYTPRQGNIWFSAVAQSNSVEMSVRDNGEGFTAEDGKRLFDRFFRIDRARTNHVPGTGLGLSLARAIVEHYDGTITAHSNGPGLGSTFLVVLPVPGSFNSEPAG